MTTLLHDELLGSQAPTHRLVPKAASSAGQEAVELAAAAGLMLDRWQVDVLDGALGERRDGKWAAFEVGLVVPRQNGKGAILEARELAGLFLFGERLILHSAHEFKTAAEAFRRLLFLVQNTPDLDRRVMRVRTSHGEEGIELRGGQRLRFVARSTGSGRGFSGDTVILDEAYNLPDHAMSALLPTMAARPNPQLWYTSSAPLPRLESDTLRRLCRRGRAGEPGRLAFFEWCASTDRVSEDREGWAAANPGLGIRISEEFIESEMGALEEEDFRRERLGIYPDDDGGEPAIPAADWELCQAPESKLAGPLVLAFEVSLDRSWGVIAAAGLSTFGGTHVEVIDNHPGTGWMVGRLLELVARHSPDTVVCNASGPAGGLLADCERAGLSVRTLTGADVARACGAAYDDIVGHQWRHLDQPVLNVAVGGTVRRDIGDVFVFDRRGAVDISPFAAVVLAASVVVPPSVLESIW